MTSDTICSLVPSHPGTFLVIRKLETAVWIKVCGIRDLATARDAAQLGADAIGLNFYKQTVRHVCPNTAKQIVTFLRANPASSSASRTDAIEPIGLFVNHSITEVIETCHRCQIRTIQLHGDETPGVLAQLAAARSELQFIRAFRLGDDGLPPLGEFLEECRTLGVEVDYCLIDAQVDGSYGGSGKTAPWGILKAEYRRKDWPPLILAGGLRPDNVAEAIRTVRPWGVDVASGVESSPGHKNRQLVQQFIEQARSAFAEISADNS